MGKSLLISYVCGSAVALVVGAGCGSSHAAKVADSRVASTQCSADARKVSMQVIYAPGGVMVNWLLPRVSPARLQALHTQVKDLAQETSRDLALHHPAASLHSVEEGHMIGFTVSDADTEELDSLRAQLDEAAVRFTRGSCQQLITSRPPAVLTSAVP